MIHAQQRIEDLVATELPLAGFGEQRGEQRRGFGGQPHEAGEQRAAVVRADYAADDEAHVRVALPAAFCVASRASSDGIAPQKQERAAPEVVVNETMLSLGAELEEPPLAAREEMGDVALGFVLERLAQGVGEAARARARPNAAVSSDERIFPCRGEAGREGGVIVSELAGSAKKGSTAPFGRVSKGRHGGASEQLVVHGGKSRRHDAGGPARPLLRWDDPVAKNRLFFPQAALDTWVVEERIELTNTELTVKVGGAAGTAGRRYRLVEAAHVLAEVTGTPDPHEILGRVKSKGFLTELGAEMLESSMMIGDNAYDIEPGFLGTPLESFAVFHERASQTNEGPPRARTDEELLGALLLADL